MGQNLSAVGVAEELGSLGNAYLQYRRIVIEEGIDGRLLHELTDEILKTELKVQSALHRKKILNTIALVHKPQDLDVSNAPRRCTTSKITCASDIPEDAGDFCFFVRHLVFGKPRSLPTKISTTGKVSRKRMKKFFQGTRLMLCRCLIAALLGGFALYYKEFVGSLALQNEVPTREIVLGRIPTVTESQKKPAPSASLSDPSAVEMPSSGAPVTSSSGEVFPNLMKGKVLNQGGCSLRTVQDIPKLATHIDYKPQGKRQILQTVYIKDSQPRGAYLWHHDELNYWHFTDGLIMEIWLQMLLHGLDDPQGIDFRLCQQEYPLGLRFGNGDWRFQILQGLFGRLPNAADGWETPVHCDKLAPDSIVLNLTCSVYWPRPEKKLGCYWKKEQYTRGNARQQHLSIVSFRYFIAERFNMPNVAKRRLLIARRTPNKDFSKAQDNSRCIINAAQLENVINDFALSRRVDVAYFGPHPGPWKDQIKAFSSAFAFVGMHSAQFANMIYMPTGSAVIQFMAEGFHFEDFRINLAGPAGIKYFEIACHTNVKEGEVGGRDAQLRVRNFEIVTNILSDLDWPPP